MIELSLPLTALPALDDALLRLPWGPIAGEWAQVITGLISYQ